MDHDRTRILRLRLISAWETDSPWLEPEVGAAEAFRGTPRFLGQVVNGGAMAGAVNRVFLVNPVSLSGTEAEGAPRALLVDGTRTIPVVVIGTSAPRAGDLLLALAVGGRWVAETGGAAPVPCSPCPIPKTNLILSWTNSVIGPGSTSLVFTPAGEWVSACTNRVVYRLSCTGGAVQLTVIYYTSGDCLSGQGQTCISPGSNPFAISLDSFSCSPFLLGYTVSSSGCPLLWNNGYTAFTITE